MNQREPISLGEVIMTDVEAAKPNWTAEGQEETRVSLVQRLCNRTCCLNVFRCCCLCQWRLICVFYDWLSELWLRRQRRLARHKWLRRQRKWKRDLDEMAKEEEHEMKMRESRRLAGEMYEEQGVGFLQSAESNGMTPCDSYLTLSTVISGGSQVPMSQEQQEKLITCYLMNDEFLEELRQNARFMNSLGDDEDSDDYEDTGSNKKERRKRKRDPQQSTELGENSVKDALHRDADYFRRKLATMTTSSKQSLVEFIQQFDAKRRPADKKLLIKKEAETTNGINGEVGSCDQDNHSTCEQPA